MIKKQILWVLPKSLAHKLLYSKRLNKKLNLKNPIDLNEKIHYLIVKKYGRREGYLSDKYWVKNYVSKLNINDLYIPKTIKIFKNVSDIKFDELPEKFVLKCTHGSGNVFVCTNKNKFDFQNAKKVLSNDLNHNFAKNTLEYHYKYIKPLIILEEYLNDNVNVNPIDYKFYVFNGVCDRILVCSERSKKLKLCDYDLNWNKLDDVLPNYLSNKTISAPKRLKKMINIAEELCKKNGKVVIPFARVDLYNINGKIYFGEYTFTPAAGLIRYYNDSALKELGKKINLSKYK